MALTLNLFVLFQAYFLTTLPAETSQSVHKGNTKGRAFLLSFLKNFGGDSQNSIIITTEKMTRVFVYIPPTETLLKRVLLANSSLHLKLPRETAVTSWGIPERKAVSVYSTEPVSVYGVTYRNRSGGGYLAIPLDKWSRQYIVATYDGVMNCGGEIIIISAEDNTVISLRLNVIKTTRCVAKQRIVVDTLLMSIHLNKDELYRIACDDDLTGSVINSSKPVGVISGNTCTQVPANVPFCDHLAEMMIPTSSLGQDYILAALGGRDTIFRVIYTDDKGSTNLTTESIGTNVTVNKANRLYKEYTISALSVVRLHATKPVLVMLYSLGTNNTRAYGDPSMVTVVPVDRYDSDYNVDCNWNQSLETFHFIFDINVYSPGRVAHRFEPPVDMLWSTTAFGFTVVHANVTNNKLLTKQSFIPDSNIIFSASALGTTMAFPVGMKLDYFTGADNCSESPCLNGGICYTHGTRLACYCGDELTGDHCETDILDACSSFPCQNNSSCTDLPYMFQCVCRDNFTGDFCETEMKTTTTTTTTTSKPKTTHVRETEKCTCRCENVTAEEIKDKKEQIKKELTVDAKKTTKNKIRHISAYDARPSAVGIGIVGILFLALAFGCFMVLDLITAATYIVVFIRNRRNPHTLDKYVDTSTLNTTLSSQLNHYASPTSSNILPPSGKASFEDLGLSLGGFYYAGDKPDLVIAPQQCLKSLHPNARATRKTVSETVTGDARNHIHTSVDSSLALLYAQPSFQESTCTHNAISLPRFKTESSKILVVGEDGNTFRVRRYSWTCRKLVVTQTCHSSDHTQTI